MSISLISGFILILVVCSLVVSSISYNRQKVIAQRRKEVARYAQAAEELSAYRDFLLNVDPEYDILALVQRQLLGALEQILEREPNDAKVRRRAELEKSCFQDINQQVRANTPKQIMIGDEDLTQAKRNVAAIAKHLDLSRNAGTISPANHQNLVTHIKNIGFLIEVESHQHQAQIFADQGDVVLFQTHLKKARDALRQAPIDTDQKNQRIRQLSDALTETKRTNKVVHLPALENEAKTENETDTTTQPS